MTGLWICEVETEHFRWRGFGLTQEGAENAFDAMWEHNDTQGSGSDARENYGARCYLARPGRARRDDWEVEIDTIGPRTASGKQYAPGYTRKAAEHEESQTELREAEAAADEQHDRTADERAEYSKPEYHEEG